MKPPSSQEKAELMQAGLGLRSLSLTDSTDPDVFMREIMEAYPKLQNVGGFDLLRTGSKRHNMLEVLLIPSTGHSASFVRSLVGQAKVYIRPIQQDIGLEAQEDSGTVSVILVHVGAVVILVPFRNASKKHVTSVIL